MADYTPAFTPGTEVTYRAVSDVTGGRVVEVVAANRGVAHTSGPSTKVVGIAAHDAKAGHSVTVFRLATQLPTSAGAFAVGDSLSSAAAGKVAKAADGGPVIATALDAATGADQVVEANFQV